MKRSDRALIGWLAVLLLATGCAGHRGAQATYHDPNMDFGLIQTVAVLPFDNLTASNNAGDTVRDVFMTMLQASVDIYVIAPGEVRRGISRVQPENPEAPTEDEFVRLAENIGADVLITGTVLEYGEVRSGSAASNVCSVSVQMIEGQTGRVVWSATATRGGVSAGDRLVGGGGQPMNLVVSKTVDDLLNRLFQ
jgi:TolB-like protein